MHIYLISLIVTVDVMYNVVSGGGLSFIWNKRKYQSINQFVS